MAAGNFTVLNKAKKKLADGTFDLDSHTFKMALCTNVVVLLANFAGTSTNAQFSDITSETTGSGYTAGGNVMNSVTWVDASGTETWNSNAVAWGTATITAKYCVIYDNSATNKDILGFMDLDTTSAIGVTSAASTFTVLPSASGWFSLS